MRGRGQKTKSQGQAGKIWLGFGEPYVLLTSVHLPVSPSPSPLLCAWETDLQGWHRQGLMPSWPLASVGSWRQQRRPGSGGRRSGIHSWLVLLATSFSGCISLLPSQLSQAAPLPSSLCSLITAPSLAYQD